MASPADASRPPPGHGAGYGHVAVIGAGAVGLCCALELLDAGLRVTVLERGDGRDGASHGNAGMLVPSHAVPLAAPGVIAQGLRWLFRRDSPLYVRPRLDVELLRWLWLFRRACTAAHVHRAGPVLRDLALESVAWYRRLNEEVGGFRMEGRGLLLVHRTEAGGDHDRAEARMIQALGLDVELLDARALASLEPGLRSEAAGALYFRQDAHLDPGLLVGVLQRRVRAAGAQIRFGAEVREVTARRGGGLELEVGDDLLRVDRVVIAGGALSGRLARGGRVRLPLQPAKGYSVTLPRGDMTLRLPVIDSEVKVTVTPMGDRVRFAGTLELGGFDGGVDARRVRPILEMARRYQPGLDVEAAATGRAGPRVWSGFRPCSPDGLPFIGSPGDDDRLIVATGHGMLGITLAPATARLVRDLVTEGTRVPAPVRADRYTRPR